MHKLIFEGAELAGKSWLMSRVYNYLEPKYNQSGQVLDGCHWLNADVGIFGTAAGAGVIDGYLQIFNALKDRNVLVEKFHLSDLIYNRIYNQKEINYSRVEQELADLNFKTILVTFPEDEAILQQRIQDRLNLYPHYKNILKEPAWYIERQQNYREACQKSQLPFLEIKTDKLPDDKLVMRILEWIGER